ncbi:fap1 adhesin isoform X2 [Polyergus mexicanus]|uniref:fap1 adhesin isoform X2 n=1 Tax=Polyergus mexicanus TaxID=615972 RepID=UPI0038B55508
MSEGSKMGLFGSKDRNQEQREKSSKDNSPARYAPYGVDSDTETYDTEALSMMDINDIIGVQSGEQVGDSTLESEIAALSQIITESKMESTSQLMDPKPETQQDVSKNASSSTSNTVHVTNIDNIDISNTDESSIMSEKYAANEICETQKTMLDNSHKKVTREKLSTSIAEKSVSENTEMDSAITCDKTSDVNINENFDDASVSASELSFNDKSCIEINSPNITLDDTLQETVQSKQQVDASPKDYEKDTIEKTKNQSVDETHENQKTLKNDTKSVVTVGGISKSLQLIGEAYNSEDSEETDMNDSDFSKETPSFSQETLLLGVSTIEQEKKMIEKNSEVVDMPEHNIEKISQLSDNASATISEESKIDVIDSRTKNSNISIKKSEDSSQSGLLQQNLEVQENIDGSESNKATEFDSELSSGMHEQDENNTEIDKVNITEEMSLECQSSNETSQETIDILANTSTTSSMELVNLEKCQETEIKNIGSELNISIIIPEMEKQDSLIIPNEKELDTKNINDNCPDDNDVKDVPKDKDILLESANETQDSVISEVSDKKLSMTEVINKSDDLQEENIIIESCQTTQEIISITNKINDEFQETSVIKMDLVSTTTVSNNQDNMDFVNIEETSVLNDKNIFQTASSVINEELVFLNENTSLSQPYVEEKNVTTNEESLSDNLGGESSDLFSANLIIQNDTNSNNIDNSVETTTHTEENLPILESLISVKHDESVKQLPSILEMPKVNDVNDTVSNKLEDLSVPILYKDLNNTIENMNEPLHEAKEIENIEMKISEVMSLSINKNQSKTPPMETKPQQICDQLESHIPDEKSDAYVNNSIKQIEEDDTNSLCNTITERKNDKIEENVAMEISNEKKIKENETFVPNLKEKDVLKSEKNTDAETYEISLGLEISNSRIDSKSDAQAANLKDVNLQADEEMKLCDETAEVPKKESEELIDVNVTSIAEEKSMEPVVEKSINTNDVQSSIINIINMSLAQKNSNERTNIENLIEKLPQDSGSMDAPTVTQTTNTLEGLLNLNLISDNKSSTLKDMQIEDKILIKETVNKDADIDQVDQSETTMTENLDSITNVIAGCLTNRDNETSGVDINVIANDKTTENEDNSLLRMNKNINTKPVNEITDEEKIKEPLEADNNLSQNNLDMDFEDNRLESVEDLEESEVKLELSQDILLESVMARENLSRNVDTPIVIENSQSSSEISELESAVKFLQESEEQTIDSPLVLSPKMVESVVEDITKQTNAELYVSDEIDNYANAESELANLRNVSAANSISISEAEIISEAAKLENERKFSAQIRNAPDTKEKGAEEITKEIKPNKETEDHTCSKTLSKNVSVAHADTSLNLQVVESMHEEKNTIPDIKLLSSEDILKTCDKLPRVSILEERLKEPPKIEIPVPDSAKVLESSISPNDNLLIPKDARAIAYSRMLESPKSTDKAELKGVDTPRKDLEKHSDPENVGSPRIILKIAKSAITDCSEPRSPKSPKIRSATNSPNPEDSPGQKLAKIKLKLSKGGHPSIISNENLEEINQWHTTDNAPSLSPLGMKIKLSKSGDASIVGSEKHEHSDETKYKIEEPKRTDSPIGMKIKLSKSGDASIISDSRQQDCTKEILTKHKEKLEIPGSPKRTESPIGMKIKLSKSGDASIIQTDRQESLEEVHREVMPKRTDSPIGMKIKLLKTGDASIVSPDACEDAKDSYTKAKEKQDNSELPKRTESPIGMKIKLTKSKGGASIISVDNTEDTKEIQKLEVPEPPKRTESPLGMKIKLSKTGDASIIHSEVTDDIKETRHKEKSEVTQDMTKASESLGFKLKILKMGETTSSILPDMIEEQDAPRSSELFTGVIPKIKVSKSGDALVMPDKTEPTKDSISQEDQQAEVSKRTESPLGMKIKLSKSGDASIVQNETVAEDHQNKTISHVTDAEYFKNSDSSLGMKIKLFKTGDASVMEAPSSGSLEKKDKQQRRRDAAESPLEIKIKLSKTGHPTIVACDSHGESSAHKGKDSQAAVDPTLNFPHRYMEHATVHKESTLKILKTGHHPSILQGSRAELTIEPVQMQSRKQPTENVQQIEISPKRKDITISPVESKKSKLEAQLSQILPEVTIQPVMCRDQKQQQQQLLFDPKSSLISRQQMNVINQEISITQVRPTAKADNASSVNDKLKDLLCKNATNSPGGSSDCEIIEHRPELIIVNENSNSSQDVVIIEEVTPNRMTDIKVPKKRGRPRRNPIATQQRHIQQSSVQMLIPRDPLALDEMQQVPPQQLEHRENERPKRTCRNQKSYAPPKRGRGRGRGKRKLDNIEPQVGKKSRIDQDLSAIEASTMAVITIDETTPVQQDSLRKSSELYKALKQPPIDRKSSACKEKHIALTSRKETGKRDSAFKASESNIAIQLDSARLSYVQEDPERASTSQTTIESLASKVGEQHKRTVLEIVSEKTQKTAMKQYAENKGVGKALDAPSRTSEIKEIPVPPPGHSNWLTPTSKKLADSTAIRGETVSMVQVIDEETRMSAESGSRSQTPARNISAPASETIINEESQGSVLSTATTESEKVKVKNRRMEINFDPDEGPFTVDKIAEYEWPLDRKGETFMIQEQISQYLGVKSFKRKYPDLKRRVVDMEERNYLRENGLVSEAMCDMGLTAVCSSEVLDVMCSDFPDQYEEYRKHMREKQVKEHSKKQKELTAAANAERNRIDLAEMAVQSAFAWNSNLNKARKENRKCCLDLQTFTIHVPKKQQKVDSEHKVGHYPVALIPGQYTDYYREYTPAELRYYPLNTVLYGPTRPNERKCDSQSEGSQSDSDSESSSDDSSSSSSEGTQDTEGSQSTMDDVDMEISNLKDDVKLKCKMCLKVLNKHNKNEILIQCGTCNGNVHPSCIDLTLDMVPHIQSYAWQCTDCKTCAQCHDPADEDKMLFCDMCDRGYHIYCVGLRRVPQGRWHCQECAVCANCGSREAGGANSDRNSVAQWQHEYKKGERNTRVYVSTLCVPCSKLWRKGRYCPHCSRCHTAQRLDLEANLVHCSACDKYLHLECVETKGVLVDKKSYLCDFCTPSTRQQVTKPLMSKMFKT